MWSGRPQGGTGLVAAGVDVKPAQAVLRHTDARVTSELYAQVVAEQHRKALDVIGAVPRAVTAGRRLLASHRRPSVAIPSGAQCPGRKRYHSSRVRRSPPRVMVVGLPRWAPDGHPDLSTTTSASVPVRPGARHPQAGDRTQNSRRSRRLAPLASSAGPARLQPLLTPCRSRAPTAAAWSTGE